MKRIEEVPEWFKLSNYEKCHDLTPEEWYRQLFYRHELFFSVQFFDQLPESEDPET